MLHLVRFSLRRPWMVLAVLAAGTVAAALGLFRLELRTDGAAIYPVGDRAVTLTVADRAAFEEPEQILLLVSSRTGGPRLDSPEGFRFLGRIHEELQRLPGVPPLGVRSLASLVVPPTPGHLDIVFFLEKPVPLDRIPLARGLFLSQDGGSAAVYVSVAPGTGRRELIATVERWAAGLSAPFELRITGPVAAEAELGDEVLRDLSRLVPAMTAAVALLLWMSLRTPGGVLVPLAQVLATLVWTLGLMGWTGVPVTLVTTILPVLLMAMSITDEIHLLERLQQRLPPGAPDRERLRLGAEASYADLVRPLVLTSLTTVAGFFSFLGASLPPLRDLGLFAGVGLLLAMVFSHSLVPALLMLLPPRWVERRPEPGRETALSVPERLLARRSRAFALAGALLLAAAVPGVFLLRVQDSWIDNFDPRSPLVTAERDFNRAFWGSYRFDVVLEGRRQTFWTPRGMALLESVAATARRAPHVGGVLSPADLFAMGAGAYGHPLPVSALPPLEIERVGLLLEAASLRIDLRHFLTPDAGSARIRLFVRDADFARGEELRRHLEDRLPALTAGTGVRWHLSGDVPTGMAVVGSIVGNQLRSVGWTAVQIGAMLLLATRRPVRTLVLLGPVAAAALLLFAALGYSGTPLGIATSLFAALTLGAGVDFALHYAHAWDRERSVEATLRTAGRGLLWNALVLAFGFSVLTASAVRPNASLGLLLAAAMLVSYATTVVFLPELLRREKGGGAADRAPAGG